MNDSILVNQWKPCVHMYLWLFRKAGTGSPRVLVHGIFVDADGFGARLQFQTFS